MTEDKMHAQGDDMMTSAAKNDSDILERSLTPAERYIYKHAKFRTDEPFCFLDFKGKYAHGTIRNALSKLKKDGLVKLYCRSSVAFYVSSSSKLKMSSKPMTVNHMVGRGGVRGVCIDLGAFLDSLDWEDICRVHDVVLGFSIDGVYDLFLENHVGQLIRVSKDIQFGSFVWSKGRVLKVVLHCSGKVTSYLKCSECPLEVSIDGLARLASFLGGIRIRLIATAASLNHEFDEQTVPDACDWVVSQWHYGRDCAREISGPAFNVTFKTWFNELARIYMRHNGQLLKPRLEVIETPKKTLPEAFAEKIDPYYKR
jgi:hypothetical protein